MVSPVSHPGLSEARMGEGSIGNVVRWRDPGALKTSRRVRSCWPLPLSRDVWYDLDLVVLRVEHKVHPDTFRRSTASSKLRPSRPHLDPLLLYPPLGNKKNTHTSGSLASGPQSNAAHVEHLERELFDCALFRVSESETIPSFFSLLIPPLQKYPEREREGPWMV